MEFWNVHSAVSGNGFEAALIESQRRPGEFRLAFKLPLRNRWKIGGVISQKAGLDLLNTGRSDLMKGHGYAPFCHKVRTHHRETIRPRLKKRRVKQVQDREMRAIKHLPNFGMF